MSTSLCPVIPFPFVAEISHTVSKPKITSPASSAPHLIRREATASGPVISENGRVLCVDDCAMFRSYYAAALGRLKVTPDFACDAYEALRLFEQGAFPYALVITDHEMPGISGLQFALELRRRGFMGWICMSSTASPETIFAECTVVPLNVYFPKPMRMADLRMLLTMAGVFYVPGENPKTPPTP